MNLIQQFFSNTVWKIKAKARSKAMKMQNKRIRELETSRDKWKDKAMKRQAKIEELEKRNREIEVELKKN